MRVKVIHHHHIQGSLLLFSRQNVENSVIIKQLFNRKGNGILFTFKYSYTDIHFGQVIAIYVNIFYQIVRKTSMNTPILY